MFYAPGLIVFSAAKVFVPAFYATQDTKTPVRVGIYTVLLNLTLNIIFILTLPTYWKHAGMAFATVLAEAVGMTALGILLSRRMKHIAWRTIGQSFARSLTCALLMAAVAWITVRYTAPLYAELVPAKVAQIIAVAIAVGCGGMTYLLLSIALHAPELQEIKSAFRRKR